MKKALIEYFARAFDIEVWMPKGSYSGKIWTPAQGEFLPCCRDVKVASNNPNAKLHHCKSMKHIANRHNVAEAELKARYKELQPIIQAYRGKTTLLFNLLLNLALDSKTGKAFILPRALAKAKMCAGNLCGCKNLGNTCGLDGEACQMNAKLKKWRRFKALEESKSAYNPHIRS